MLYWSVYAVIVILGCFFAWIFTSRVAHRARTNWGTLLALVGTLLGFLVLWLPTSFVLRHYGVQP